MALMDNKERTQTTTMPTAIITVKEGITEILLDTRLTGMGLMDNRDIIMEPNPTVVDAMSVWLA
jgi:hypothetical protein